MDKSRIEQLIELDRKDWGRGRITPSTKRIIASIDEALQEGTVVPSDVAEYLLASITVRLRAEELNLSDFRAVFRIMQQYFPKGQEAMPFRNMIKKNQEGMSFSERMLFFLLEDAFDMKSSFSDDFFRLECGGDGGDEGGEVKV